MKKLLFRFNKELDRRMAEEFLNVRGGGIDFGAGILKLHPRLRRAKKLSSVKEREKIIRAYFNSYYRTNDEKLRRRIGRVRRAWRAHEVEYIAVTEKLFGGFRFPPGKYIAYASIINCNPRFLDSKTFQFFYKKATADAVHTIAHELLHFIFFDFVERKLKNVARTLPPEKLWDLSEIFNVVILRLPAYRRLIDHAYVSPYPAHKKYLHKFEAAYRKSRDMKEFIRRGAIILN